jgi:hypothetical protein
MAEYDYGGLGWMLKFWERTLETFDLNVSAGNSNPCAVTWTFGNNFVISDPCTSPPSIWTINSVWLILGTQKL